MWVRHLSRVPLLIYSTVGIRPVCQWLSQSHSFHNTWNQEMEQPCERQTPFLADDNSGRTWRCFSLLSPLNGLLVCFVCLFRSPLLLVTRVLEPFPDALWWRTPGTRETNSHLQWRTQRANKEQDTTRVEPCCHSVELANVRFKIGSYGRSWLIIQIFEMNRCIMHYQSKHPFPLSLHYYFHCWYTLETSSTWLWYCGLMC